MVRASATNLPFYALTISITILLQTHSTAMEVTSFCSSSRSISFLSSFPSITKSTKQIPSSFSPLLIHSMAAAEKPPAKTVRSRNKKINSTVFPLGEKGPRSGVSVSSSPQIKLLTRVEQLRLLSKAEKAGLLSAAEKAGLSLSSIEKLGLLSKVEELGILSAATDPGTPGALLSLGLGLLVIGPLCVYLVPEDSAWEIGLQAAAVVVSVVGGSAAFVASNLVSDLQRSN